MAVMIVAPWTMHDPSIQLLRFLMGIPPYNLNQSAGVGIRPSGSDTMVPHLSVELRRGTRGKPNLGGGAMVSDPEGQTPALRIGRRRRLAPKLLQPLHAAAAVLV